MRILHAYKIYRPDIEGGIPAVISSLADARDANDSHSVLCARRRGTARNYRIDGVSVEALASLGTLFSTPVAPAYIPSFIRRTRSADLVLHHAPLPLNDAAILLGLPADVALVVYWHAEIVGFNLLKRMVSPLIRRVLDRADRIVVSGQPMIDNSEFLRPHAHKCAVVPYGMDVDYWRTLDPDDQAKAGRMRSEQPRHIVSLGRLVGYKGHDVLIRAMRSVNGHATIIGEGPLLPELQQLARDMGVADRVRFAGRLPRDDIRRLFHSAQVFAFPSVTIAEAFGIVQIEAMAAGLPVVNTDLKTTVPLVARHGIEALTVPVGDPDAFAVALRRILDDEPLARALTAAGKERVLNEFNQSDFHTRMTTVYADAVQTNRARRARPDR